MTSAKTKAERLHELLVAIRQLEGLRPVHRDAIGLAIALLLDATITADDPWCCRVCGKSPCATSAICAHRYEHGPGEP